MGRGVEVSGPTVIRHLATATGAYRVMAEDTKAVIEDALADAQLGGGQYHALLDNLRALLDDTEVGSLPSVAEECRVLLGEAERRS
jgi:hypothetical protein